MTFVSEKYVNCFIVSNGTWNFKMTNIFKWELVCLKFYKVASIKQMAWKKTFGRIIILSGFSLNLWFNQQVFLRNINII